MARTLWSTVLRAVFLLFILLILGAVVYAGWIVSRYWNVVGV